MSNRLKLVPCPKSDFVFLYFRLLCQCSTNIFFWDQINTTVPDLFMIPSAILSVFCSGALICISGPIIFARFTHFLLKLAPSHNTQIFRIFNCLPEFCFEQCTYGAPMQAYATWSPYTTSFQVHSRAVGVVLTQRQTSWYTVCIQLIWLHHLTHKGFTHTQFFVNLTA